MQQQQIITFLIIIIIIMNLNKNNEFNKTVLYFSAPKTDRSHHMSYLKGSKLKSRDQSKIYQLRTKHVDRYNLWYLNRQNNDEFSSTLLNKKKKSIDHLKHKSYLRSPTNRPSLIQDSSDIVISSQSNQMIKENSKQLPNFSSANLEGKMNEYLNILIRKSQEDQQQKIKKLLESHHEFKKNSTQNTFLRKMKVVAKKKRYAKDPIEDSSINLQASETIRMLKEKQYDKKVQTKLPTFFTK